MPLPQTSNLKLTLHTSTLSSRWLEPWCRCRVARSNAHTAATALLTATYLFRAQVYTGRRNTQWVRLRSRRVRFPVEPHGGPRWRRGAVDGTAVRWPVSRARTPQSARARALAPVRSGRSALCGAARLAFTARVRRRRHHRRSPPPRVAAAAHHERSTAAGARCRSSRRLARFTAAGADANGRFWRGWRGTARRSVLHAGSADGAVGGAQARRLASCGGAKPHRVWVNRASAAGARRGLRRC